MGHVMTYSTYNWIWNLILNIWFVGFFIGIWFSPLLNDRFGRKVGYLVGNAFSLVGAIFRLLSICLYRPELLFVGRLITSVCGAITYQSCILFLQECSPTHLRGFLSFLSEISFAVMCLFGTLLGTQQLLGNDLIAYMGFAVPFCAFFFAVLFFIPETPKYLLISRLNREDAERSVKFYHGKEVDVDANKKTLPTSVSIVIMIPHGQIYSWLIVENDSLCTSAKNALI
uniref:MFS domain-containing protein n=1 Tax=Heterorhabditis bacteriophora TaxID=37862 RepID=A0A1I7XP83_HETBA